MYIINVQCGSFLYIEHMSATSTVIKKQNIFSSPEVLLKFPSSYYLRNKGYISLTSNSLC